MSYHKLLSTFPFKFNLRRYIKQGMITCQDPTTISGSLVGRCRLTLSNPR